MEKKCNKCGELKDISMFSIDKRNRDGHQGICKVCSNGRVKCYIKSHPELAEGVKKRNKEWYLQHKEKCKRYRVNNIEKIRERDRNRPSRRRRNPNRPVKVYMRSGLSRSQYQREYNREIRKTPKGNLNHRMSCSVYKSLKYNTKGRRHWENLVGYTIDQLQRHIEKRFTPGMAWENYGIYWHIDHKIPLSIFNFERPEDIDFRLCWSLKNLQPLEAKANIKKGAKINKPFQPALLLSVQGG